MPVLSPSAAAVMTVAQLASFHFNGLIRSEVQMCFARQAAAAADQWRPGALIMELAVCGAEV